MTRVRVLAVLVLGLSVLAWSTAPRALAAADETKTARGTVTAMSGNSLTVKVGAKEMMFNVDEKTEVVARGAGTKSKQAQAKGMAGPKLADVITTGQAVEVKYHDANGSMHAASIKAVASAGASGGSMSEAKPATKSASGTVKSVGADSLTVTGGGKDWTFSVDSKTTVIGTGVGTKTKKMGGKAAITDLVSNGDKVNVTYHETGATMHASRVNITSKAK